MRAAAYLQESPGDTQERTRPVSPAPLWPELKSWLDDVILPILLEELIHDEVQNRMADAEQRYAA